LRKIVKLRKKGVLILPKKIREEVGIKEGDDLVVTVKKGEIILRKFEPLKVRIDPDKVDKLLREELELEEEKVEEVLKRK